MGGALQLSVQVHIYIPGYIPGQVEKRGSGVICISMSYPNSALTRKIETAVEHPRQYQDRCCKNGAAIFNNHEQYRSHF